MNKSQIFFILGGVVFLAMGGYLIYSQQKADTKNPKFPEIIRYGLGGGSLVGNVDKIVIPANFKGEIPICEDISGDSCFVTVDGEINYRGGEKLAWVNTESKGATSPKALAPQHPLGILLYRNEKPNNWMPMSNHQNIISKGKPIYLSINDDDYDDNYGTYTVSIYKPK